MSEPLESPPTPPGSPPWELYETFLEVMRGGSFSAAARALGVAQPTARRRVEELERTLGVVLFTRAVNGLTPTDAAHATLPYAEAMGATARALERAISAPEDAARGTVRLAASEIVGAEVLPEALAELRRAHPGIDVELAVSNRNEDLLRRDADLAVRMVRPEQAALVARRVGEVELGLFATRGYLEARGVPLCPDEIRAHALVGDDRRRGLLGALASRGVRLRPRDFAFRSDADLAQLAAVRAGLGIGVCQVPLAERAPRLRRVLPELKVPLEVWLVMHEDLRRVRRVRIVYEHLLGFLERYLGDACAG